jgi:hypothetical protein
MEIKALSRNQLLYPIMSQEWFREIDYIGNLKLINLTMLANKDAREEATALTKVVKVDTKIDI